MTVLLTKANHDTWHRYKEFNTIEELFEYINYCHSGLILHENQFYNFVNKNATPKAYNSIEFLAETWDTTIEDAYKINGIKWEVEIYNSYIE